MVVRQESRSGVGLVEALLALLLVSILLVAFIEGMRTGAHSISGSQDFEQAASLLSTATDRTTSYGYAGLAGLAGTHQQLDLGWLGYPDTTADGALELDGA